MNCFKIVDGNDGELTARVEPATCKRNPTLQLRYVRLYTSFASETQSWLDQTLARFCWTVFCSDQGCVSEANDPFNGHGDPDGLIIVSHGDLYGIFGGLFRDSDRLLAVSHGDPCKVFVGSYEDPYGTFYVSSGSYGDPHGILHGSHGSHGSYVKGRQNRCKICLTKIGTIFGSFEVQCVMNECI